MNPYRHNISLRFYGVAFDPIEVSEALSLIPKHSWKSGDEIINPLGTLSKGLRSKSYWSYRFETAQDSTLEDSLSTLLPLLRPHKVFLSGMKAKGVDIELFIGLFGSRNFGLTITHADSRHLSELGIDLGFDIYPESKKEITEPGGRA